MVVRHREGDAIPFHCVHPRRQIKVGWLKVRWERTGGVRRVGGGKVKRRDDEDDDDEEDVEARTSCHRHQWRRRRPSVTSPSFLPSPPSCSIEFPTPTVLPREPSARPRRRQSPTVLVPSVLIVKFAATMPRLCIATTANRDDATTRRRGAVTR